ncbi:MAG: class I SAM-dependent methyltransferase [Nitrososphaerales archaeon]
MLNDLILTIQDWFARQNYRKNRSLLLDIMDPKPEDILLDIGGGTGLLAQMFAEICKEIYVLDPEAKKLTYAIKKRKAMRFIHGSADLIPVRDDYFSKIMGIVSFHHFPDQNSALNEMKRVLNPNGLLVLNEFDPSTLRGKLVNFHENKLMNMNCKYYPPSQLNDKFTEHGYKEISIIPSPIGYFLTAMKY